MIKRIMANQSVTFFTKQVLRSCLTSCLLAVWLYAGLASAAPREVNVGVYANEPKIFLSEKNQPTGILGDLLLEIAEKEGWKLKIVPCAWDDCLKALAAGQIDLLPDLAYSEERAQTFGFHKIPALHGWSQIYRREGAKINSLLDLQGKRIAVLKNSIQEKYLQEQLLSFGVQAELVAVSSLDMGFAQTAGQSVDAVVANRFFGERKAPQYKLIGSPIIFQPAQLFYGTRLGSNTDLLVAIDRNLDEWTSRNNSIYFKVLTRWMPGPPAPPVPTWLWIALGVLASVLLAALLGNQLLRRKVAEQTKQLRRDKEALHLQALVLDQIHDHVTITTLDGTVIYVNQAELSGMQHTKDDIIGQHVAAYGEDPATDSLRKSIVERTITQGEWHGQVINYRDDGSSMHLDLRTSVVKDEGGRPIALVGIATDLTTKREADAALAESETKFSTLLQNIPGTAFRCLLDEYWTVLFISDGIAQISGYPASQFLSGQRHFSSIIHPSDVRDIDTTVRIAIAKHIPYTVEYRIQHADGKTRWLWERGQGEFDEAGELRWLDGVFFDITEQKQAAAELEKYRTELEQLVEQRTTELEVAKNIAESANIAKSAFLANMSHEIRTPLNAITGMAYLIRRSGLSAKQEEQLSKLEGAGEHLLQIINAILDLSKIEAGKFTLENTPVSIEKIIATLTTMMHERAVSKGIELISEIDPMPAQLLGDATRIQQALLNYLSNAIKFTESGSVTLRAKVLNNQADSALIRFEVSDTGVGIDPEAVPRLFSAFEQADNSTTRKYGGTGLGLAITRRLTELMGGETGFDSAPGKGATFWLTVRLAKGGEASDLTTSQTSASAEAMIRSRFAGYRILLAEDEPINCEVTLSLLTDVDLAVDLAEDGLIAVEQASRNDYALILMDMQMPNLDGLEATRQIRQMPGRGAMPIIAMTANAFTEDKLRCLEAGMNDFISKPVHPEIFFTTLLNWLSRDKH